jgi:hypothetical protein
MWRQVRAVNRVIPSRPTGGDFVKRQPPAAVYLIFALIFSLLLTLLFLRTTHNKQFTVIFYYLFVLDIFLVLTRYHQAKIGVLPHHLQIFPLGQTHIEFNNFFQIVFDMKILLYITVWVSSVFFLLRENIYMGIVITLLVVIGFLLFTSVVSSMIMSVLEFIRETYKHLIWSVILVIIVLSQNIQELFANTFPFNIFGNTLTHVFGGDINESLFNSLYILFMVSCALVVFYLFAKFKSRFEFGRT